jgi:hypothetical protein
MNLALPMPVEFIQTTAKNSFSAADSVEYREFAPQRNIKSVGFTK